MNNWLNTKESILDTEVPMATASYSPIPHRVFLEEIQEELYLKGYKIAEERYLTAGNNAIITGNYRIESDADPEMMPAITFVNSYNKTRKAEIRASALVLVCRNGALGMTDNGHYKRKHSGTALEDFRRHISLVVSGLEKEFERLVINKEEMKQIEVDKRTRALLIGDMFLNERMINSTQLNIINEQIQFSEHFKDDSLWSLYNHCTYAFHQSHALNYDRDHIKTHTYFSDNYSLTGNRGLYTPVVEKSTIHIGNGGTILDAVDY